MPSAHRRFSLAPLVIACVLALAACGAPRQINEEWRPGVPKRAGVTVAGRQEGLWTYWYDNGQKQAEGGWEHDFQQGPWSWWYANGTLKQSGAYDAHGLDHRSHSSAERTGHWRHFYEDAQLYCEGDYVHDRQQGEWTYFTRAGKPFATGNFTAGVKDGAWTWWHDAGHPAEQGHYAAGIKVGRWSRTAPDGAVQSVVEYTITGAAVAVPIKADPPPTAVPVTAPAAVATASETTSATAPPAVVKKPAEPDLALSPTAAPALSPIQSLPSLWTKQQEENVSALIRRYEAGSATEMVNGYNDDAFGGEGSRQRRDLIGKPLPQTRFLSATGDVIDLKERIGKKPVLLVILRGFSGQVCLYCATQTAALSNNLTKFDELGAELIVIYPGPVEAVPAFVQAVQSLRKDSPPVPLGLDVSLLLVRAIGIEENLAKPTSIIIDKQGVVRYAYVGKTIADRPAVNDLLQAIGRYVK